MGATATMLYGVTLLLDPVPTSNYAEEELKQKGKWSRNPFKKKGKGQDAASVKVCQAAPRKGCMLTFLGGCVLKLPILSPASWCAAQGRP